MKEQAIKKGDTFYVEGHERSHTCIGFLDNGDVIAENDLSYLKDKCSLSHTLEPVNKPISEYTALEIAVYACNAGNSKEKIEEVAKMIEDYGKEKMRLMAELFPSEMRDMRGIRLPKL